LTTARPRPRPPPRPIERTRALREQVEDPRQEVRRNPDARIAHTQHRPVALLRHLHPDRAARGRVLHRVVEEIGDDLLEAGRIAVDHRGGRRNVEPMSRRAGRECGDTVLDQLAQVDDAWLELEPAGGQPGNVEEIVDQAGEMSHLASDDLPELYRALVLLHHVQDADGAGDGSQRVAQFVAQHREELVLGPVGRLRLSPGHLLAEEAPRVAG
jgi:hypothetical protein